VVVIARLRALARRGAHSRPAVLQAGDLTLEPSTRCCERAGQVIALTPREHSLLARLMRVPGDVVSKQELVDHVWGLDYDGDLNVVEVYVGYLRKKVDHPFGTSLIHTVRGAGYRLHPGTL